MTPTPLSTAMQEAAQMPSDEEILKAALPYGHFNDELGDWAFSEEQIIKITRAVLALHRPVEQAEKDSQRLDWLEKHHASLYTCTHEERRPSTAIFQLYDKVCVFDGWAVGMSEDPRPSVREALDAAIDRCSTKGESNED